MEVIRVDNLSKLYDLGQVGTGTLAKDINRWWARVRGKEDPYARVGRINNRAQKAGKSDSVWALKDVCFSIQQGQVVGIIGKNGAGKSTLLKVVSQITSPTSGSIKVRGRVASLLEVGTGFHPEMTGRENIFMNGTLLGMTRKEIQNKLDAIVDFAGVALYLDTPVKRYSSGMQVRLGFAVGAFLEPEILIVDEVLAVGDAEFQAKATGKMREVSENSGRTVLFVSHNMGSVAKLCTQCIIMKDGQLDFMGPTPEALARYAGNMQISSEVEFSHPVVKKLRVLADDGLLILALNYHVADSRPLSLGYVIADDLGNKICGANPRLEGHELPGRIAEHGTVRAEVSLPKLREGTYRISIWVGDGYDDFFEAIDCMTVHLDDMVPVRIRTPRSVLGPVIPQTNWVYER